jgi:nitroimidazol reductase NimA-like FMN-containing flavoprotein (pyridoxamine 5'-phosphate oxidase superfamily)
MTEEGEMADERGVLAVLDSDECLRLLADAVIGRVAFQAAGTPQLLPVNFAADTDGTVVFRTDDSSVLTQVGGRAAVFETDGFDRSTHTGWSVCVQGVAREITAGDDPAAGRLLEMPVIPWAPGQRDRWFAIAPDQITGRRIPVVRAADFGWIPGVVS